MAGVGKMFKYVIGVVIGGVLFLVYCCCRAASAADREMEELSEWKAETTHREQGERRT